MVKVQKKSKNSKIPIRLEPLKQLDKNKNDESSKNNQISTSKNSPKAIRKSRNVNKKGLKIPVRKSTRKRTEPQAYWVNERQNAIDSDIWENFRKVLTPKKKSKK